MISSPPKGATPTPASNAQTRTAGGIDLPPAILNNFHINNENKNSINGQNQTTMTVHAALQTSEGSRAPLVANVVHQLYPQHQPITLVNGQKINQGFKKPEKAKWTPEEGEFHIAKFPPHCLKSMFTCVNHITIFVN